MKFRPFQVSSLVLPAAVALALAGAAGAQSGDLSAGYARVSSALSGAQSALATDPAAALTQVDAARNAFRSLSGQLKSRALQDGGAQALDAAKTAVTRHSAPDLNAQATQARAILQRAVFEGYLSSIGLDAPQAARYARLLAAATGLSDARRGILLAATSAGNVNGARAVIETQYAAIMQNALASAVAATNRATAFQAAVRASGAFLVVQDSPRLTAGLSTLAFTDALKALTGGDLAGFRADARALKTAADTYSRAWNGTVLPKAAPIAVKPAGGKATPASGTTTAPASGTKATPEAATVQPPSPAPAAATTPTTATPAPAASAGAGTPAETLERVHARISEALALVQDGRVADARARLASASALLQAARPALDARNPGQTDHLANLLDASQNAVGLKPADLGVLSSETQSLLEGLNGTGGTTLRQSVAGAIQPFWMGSVRGVLFLLVALAFCYPIYLMNLAFGGRNPYWRLIGFAMVLLFLAPLAEGLAWLGSLLASLTGWEALEALNALSVLSNPIAQVVWLVLLAACVVLATLGFRGIARQFGLLHGPGVPGATTVLEPGGSVAPSMVPAAGSSGVAQVGGRGGQTSETIVEWDEEL